MNDWKPPAEIDWQTVYETEDLIRLFDELLEDGYTGLSLGLIVDLVRRDAAEA